MQAKNINGFVYATNCNFKRVIGDYNDFVTIYKPLVDNTVYLSNDESVYPEVAEVVSEPTLKESIATLNNQLEDVQLALVELYEMTLGGDVNG